MARRRSLALAAGQVAGARQDLNRFVIVAKEDCQSFLGLAVLFLIPGGPVCGEAGKRAKSQTSCSLASDCLACYHRGNY